MYIVIIRYDMSNYSVEKMDMLGDELSCQSFTEVVYAARGREEIDNHAYRIWRL